MAPAGSKSRNKAKQATQPAAKTKKAENVVDRAERDETPNNRKQPLKRRRTEEEAEKAVRDNFKGISEAQRRMVLDRDGKSLMDRVIEAKRRKKQGEKGSHR